MFYRVAAFLTLSLLVSSPVYAGDPCPIRFDVYEAMLPWLNQADTLGALETKRQWLGITHDSKDGFVHVIRIHEGSPAEKAGLKSGDLILGRHDGHLKDADAFFNGLEIDVPAKLMVRRDGKDIPLTITPGRRDPVPPGMVDAVKGTGCLIFKRGLLTLAQATLVHSTVLKNKRFQCKDAHLALAKIDPFKGSQEQSLVIVRGTRRILVSVPGLYHGRTTCIKSADYDGKKLTKKRLQAVFDSVAKPTIDDRHANP